MKEILNEAQQRALCHTHGPAMVLAGPGSGKTTVITGRVKRLIEQEKIPPADILVLTYTKAAAQSMQQRFIREWQGAFYPVSFGTFHAVSYHILREHFYLGSECLIAEKEKIQIVNHIWVRLFHTKPETDSIEQLLLCLARYKNGAAAEALPLPANVSLEEFAAFYGAYTEYCTVKGRLDFDDMQIRCLDLFRTKPQVLECWQERFSQILVDEFQDCNKVQYEILKLLAAPQENLFVVGDDDQSIYGFRGASPDIMQQFAKDYKRAERIFLEANYRSREEIIKAAESVIVQNKKRFAKKMYAAGERQKIPLTEPVYIKGFADREEEYTCLAARLRSFSKVMPYREMCVLFRTNRELQQIIPFLERGGVPYGIKGQTENKYVHFAVKDINAYLKLAAGENGRALFLQIMNRPYRGIEREMLWEETVMLSTVAEECDANRKTEAASAVRLLQKQLQTIAAFPPSLAIGYIRKAMGYENWVRGRAGIQADVYKAWKTLLDTIQEEAKAFGCIEEWLAFAEQEERKAKPQKTEGVQLMTMHAAKGLEFTYVCIPDANEKKQIKKAGKETAGSYGAESMEEEERRLFYVGMTRAKTALDILYLTGTKACPRQPSHFIAPILKYYSDSSSTSSSNS